MSSFAFFIILLFITTHFPSLSTPIFLPLTNSLYKTQFNTTHHLLKSTSTRSAARLRQLSTTTSTPTPPLLSLPLSPGSDYTLTLSLPTTPPQSISLFLDTGSDLVWFPCKPFQCILCEDKPKSKPYFPPLSIPSSSFVPCTSTSCTAAHSLNSLPLSSNDLCAVARCPLDQIETSGCDSYPCPPFYYAYADGSFIARLHEHPISMPIRHDHDNTLTINNFTFGCAHSSLAEPTGVAGFGNGVLSFPLQLSKLYSSQLGSQFSYCLVSHSFEPDRVRAPSLLILGRPKSADQKSNVYYQGVEFVYTPMIKNEKYPFFYVVGLEGVSVGKRNIPAPEILRRVDGEGNGGVVVDSGTTFTILPSSLFKKVVTELDRRLGRVHPRARQIEDKTGLSPCYFMDEDNDNRNNNRGIKVYSPSVSDVPKIGFRFAGGGSSVMLPRENYFYEFLDGEDGLGKRRAVGCLMLMDGGDESDMGGGPGATLGNYQQQGFEVVYDLEKKRIGFARRNCSALWDNLMQH